jgi:hypothetical protein
MDGAKSSTFLILPWRKHDGGDGAKDDGMETLIGKKRVLRKACDWDKCSFRVFTMPRPEYWRSKDPVLGAKVLFWEDSVDVSKSKKNRIAKMVV